MDPLRNAIFKAVGSKPGIKEASVTVAEIEREE